MQEKTASTDQADSVASASLPTTWMDYARGVGPGLIVAMSWLGAGDLIDSSVSGANYGYALMWALALALICRYFYVSAIAKYFLCNSHGDTSILQGYGRLWRWLPLIIGIGAYISGFILQTYMAKGVGTALFYAFGQVGGQKWGVFIWTAVAVALTILVTMSKWQSAIFQWIARVAVVILIVSFVGAVIYRGADWGGMAAGLFGGVPSNKGLFPSLLVAASLIGAVGGSAANLLYPEFMQDKGWRGPAFRKLQRLDLLAGIVGIIVIDLAVWAVASETMKGQANQISDPTDLAAMMRTAIGSLGPIVLWVGLFFVTFTSFPAYAAGFTKILLNGVHEAFPPHRDRYSTEEEIPGYRDRFPRWVLIVFQVAIMTVIPLAFALPGLPNLVVLTVAGSSTSAIMAPLIIVGTVLLTMRSKHMSSGYVNKWWENVVLVVVGCIGLWAAYNVVVGLPQLFANLGG